MRVIDLRQLLKTLPSQMLIMIEDKNDIFLTGSTENSGVEEVHIPLKDDIHNTEDVFVIRPYYCEANLPVIADDPEKNLN